MGNRNLLRSHHQHSTHSQVPSAPGEGDESFEVMHLHVGGVDGFDTRGAGRQRRQGDAEPLAVLAEQLVGRDAHVVEVDGHDHLALAAALENAPRADDAPTCIVAHTTKGKGVSFMENSVLWHYRSAQGEEFEAALKELDDAR